MATFRFIHTADWHIGKPFRNFGERLGAVLEDQRLETIDRIAEAARTRGAQHVLVAGDLYDAETFAERVLVPPIRRMARHGDIAWHLLPGNHDPARPGGLWHRLVRTGLPGNVVTHVDQAPVELGPDVWLLPAPLTTKASSSDPTEWMGEAATPPGALRIGLAHGSICDFTADKRETGTIDPNRARAVDLAYLALGDWHGVKRVNARTWYAGTPEPDKFADIGAGHVLCVDAFGAAEPQVEKVATGYFRWEERQIRIGRLADLELLGAALEREVAHGERLLLHLEVSGTLPAEERVALAPWAERVRGRLRFLAVDADRLQTRATPADIERRFSDPRIVAVARRLLARAGNELDAEHAVAERALFRLMELAHAEEAA